VTDLILEQLRGLAGTLAVLESRVRTAVAGEVSRAVAEAVGEVLSAVLGGRLPDIPRWTRRPEEYDSYPGRPASSYGRDDWDDTGNDGWDRPDVHRRAQHARASGGGAPAECNAPASFDPTVTAALVLAVTLARWWRRRRGTTWGALGVGLAAAGAALGGGPLAQAALSVFWAVHRLLTATDAVGDGARAFERF